MIQQNNQVSKRSTTKTTSSNQSNSIIIGKKKYNQLVKSVSKPITTTKRIKTSLGNSKSHTTRAKGSKYPWIKWKNNSCRFDSFMTVFTLLILNQEEDFQFINQEGIHSLGYQELIATANLLNLGGGNEAINQMWLQLIDLGIEQNSCYGVFGSPISLFNLLSDIFDFQLSFITIRKCLKTEKDIRNSLPILFQVECELLNFINIDFGAEIDKVLEDRLEKCSNCQSENSLLNSNILYNQPSYMFFMLNNCSQAKYTHVQIPDIKPLKFNKSMELIGTINWCLEEPHFTYVKNSYYFDSNTLQINILEGWYQHDGKNNDGMLISIKDDFLTEKSKKMKPYIFMYKQKDC